MIGILIAILVVLVLTQVVTWLGLWAVARWLQDEIHRQDDRIRKQRERRAVNEDEDDIQDMVDRVRTAAAHVTDDEVEELLRRNPGARRPGEY